MFDPNNWFHINAFIWAAILGWLVFGETITLTTVLGTILIVSGCLVAAWQKGAPVEHAEPTST